MRSSGQADTGAAHSHPDAPRPESALPAWVLRFADRRARRRRALFLWCSLLALPGICVEFALFGGFAIANPYTPVMSMFSPSLLAMIGLGLLACWTLGHSDRRTARLDHLLYLGALVSAAATCLCSLPGFMLPFVLDEFAPFALVAAHPILVVIALLRGPERFTSRRSRLALLYVESLAALIGLIWFGYVYVTATILNNNIPLRAVLYVGAAYTAIGLLLAESARGLYVEWRMRVEFEQQGIALSPDEAEQLRLSYGLDAIRWLPLEQLSFAPMMGFAPANLIEEVLIERARTYGVSIVEKPPWTPAMLPLRERPYERRGCMTFWAAGHSWDPEQQAADVAPTDEDDFDDAHLDDDPEDDSWHDETPDDEALDDD